MTVISQYSLYGTAFICAYVYMYIPMLSSMVNIHIYLYIVNVKQVVMLCSRVYVSYIHMCIPLYVCVFTGENVYNYR